MSTRRGAQMAESKVLWPETSPEVKDPSGLRRGLEASGFPLRFLGGTKNKAYSGLFGSEQYWVPHHMKQNFMFYHFTHPYLSEALIHVNKRQQNWMNISKNDLNSWRTLFVFGMKMICS
ncbi:hypothetical protein AVEN_99858-1 [Araneus ventricosus]|uniref:Uncharacterized protein n=1 Tax=Araneus ventricosus TaxID=182803 RepID=A0A4Y2VRE1_ARAVE|nr:hypothetical protein AVEN_99858-1 [Araneus ventricosus]